jgi:5S rRNA maturation endonuclease (ribonuclease M5)
MSHRFEAILAKLQGVRRNGRQASALCPAHEDTRPSLTLKVTTPGKILLNCHAGCSPEAIVAKLGLTLADLFQPEPIRTGQLETPVAEYTYTDEQGTPLYQVLRFSPKDFRVRRADGDRGWKWGFGGVRRTLYRLPEVLEAIRNGKPLYVVEGEKDVESIRRVGAIATCNPGGAGKWCPEYTEFLRGAQVFIVSDRDEPGQRHAAEIARQLANRAASVAMLEPLTGKDSSDHLEAGHSLAELRPLNLAPEGDSSPPLVRSLRELLANPKLLHPPSAIAHPFAFRGRVALLAGREKEGKSTLAAAMAAKVTNGAPFLGHEVERGPVLWLGLEEHVGDTARRFSQLNADPDLLHIVTCLPNSLSDLEEAIRQVKPIVMVGDTLAAIVDGVIEDPHDSVAWTAVMRQLTALARSNNLGMLLVAHARKSDGKYRDSTAIGANVDLILEMETDKDDPSVRAFTPKGRWHIPPFRIRLSGTEYYAISADTPHDTQVFSYIQANPGSSKRGVREGVRGRAAETDASITRLLHAKVIESRGNGRGHGYWPRECVLGSGGPRCPDRVPSVFRVLGHAGTLAVEGPTEIACPPQVLAGQGRDTLADHLETLCSQETMSHSQTPSRELDTETVIRHGMGDAREPEEVA